MRGTPGSCLHSQSPPDVSVHSRETCFPCVALTFSRGSTHTTVARGTVLWESLVGKPSGKASRESHRSLDPGEGKRDTAATAQVERARACPHSKQGLTPPGRLQKYPNIHVSTGEESSGSGTASNKVLCRGPAPVDPGNSKGGRRWRGKTCLFINVRLD